MAAKTLDGQRLAAGQDHQAATIHHEIEGRPSSLQLHSRRYSTGTDGVPPELSETFLTSRESFTVHHDHLMAVLAQHIDDPPSDECRTADGDQSA